MNPLISGLSAATYRSIAKPIFFRQKPDAVHARMLKVASVVQQSSAARGLMHASWAYDNPERLGQTHWGIEFRNPVGLSAGFDKNFELPPTVRAIGFGFMEGGSLTFRPCDGNPRPWFYRLPRSKSLVVHAGLANEGVEAVLKRLQSYPARTLADFPINISVAKTNSPAAADDTEAIADYTGSLHYIRDTGIGDLLTINISCPNTYGGEPFTTPARLERLLREVDTLQLVQPVFIKMPNDLNWEHFDALLRVASRHSITGVTVSNLAKRHTPLNLAEPLPDDVPGGLSGKPTWERSNELIAHTYRTYGDRFTIIGVGGIFSAEDAYTKIRLGATLVELITGMIFEGPQLIGQINRGLVRLLERDGFANVGEAVGADS